MIADLILVDVRAHAAATYPRECCGVVIVWKGRQRYLPCENIATHNEHFIIRPEDFAAAEEMGEVITIVHSHPGLPPIPSQPDLVGIEDTGLPWLIVSHPTGEHRVVEPSGYVAPLVGRPFAHGVLDCYSIVRDYYSQVRQIDLPNWYREDEWWEKGQSVILDHTLETGFVPMPVNEMRIHDVLLLQVGARVPNHCAVLVDDNIILHHAAGRLSSRDVYGGWLRSVTTHCMHYVGAP